MIEISIWLFGKPSWELDIEGKDNIDPKIFKEYGDYIKEHLNKVAEITGKLQKNGWDCYGTLYTLDFLKDIKSATQAKSELKKLGISSKGMNIIKLEDEE